LAHIITRVRVADFDAFKPMFDQDAPGVRRSATAHRLYRGVDDPGEVYVRVDFPSVEEARAGAERLRASGVLSRWEDSYGPTVVEEAEAIEY
jgi:hypothetical protein